MVKKSIIEESGVKDNPFLLALGKRVRELRTAADLSQRRFGEAAGLNPTYVYLLEAGQNNPGVLALESMAKVLGVPITAFFEDMGTTAAIDPVLSKIASELHRLVRAMDLRKDEAAGILQAIAQRLEEDYVPEAKDPEDPNPPKRGEKSAPR